MVAIRALWFRQKHCSRVIFLTFQFGQYLRAIRVSSHAIGQSACWVIGQTAAGGEAIFGTGWSEILTLKKYRLITSSKNNQTPEVIAWEEGVVDLPAAAAEAQRCLQVQGFGHQQVDWIEEPAIQVSDRAIKQGTGNLRLPIFLTLLGQDVG